MHVRTPVAAAAILVMSFGFAAARDLTVVTRGGLMQAGNGRLVRDTADHLAGLGLTADVRAVSSPPIVGAALLALDDIGASAGAHSRARRELDRAVAQHGWVAGTSDDESTLVSASIETGPA